MRETDKRLLARRSTQLPVLNDIIPTVFRVSILLSGLITSSISRILDWLITIPGYFPPSVKSRNQILRPGDSLSAGSREVGGRSASCGKTCSRSDPPGTSEKVGLEVSVGMDMEDWKM